MATLRLIFAIAAAALMGGAPALAQSCHPMQSSAVGVDTGASTVLPQRCDQPGKCRIFDLGGHPIGDLGDFVIPGTASPGDLLAAEEKRASRLYRPRRRPEDRAAVQARRPVLRGPPRG